MMGYCIYYEEGSIKIKKENMKELLQSLSDYFSYGEKLRWVNGFKIEDLNNAEDEEERENIFNEIWDDLRYEVKEEDDYYIITNFLGEKYGDDDILFKLIAPYCEDGYLQFCGDEGEHFRFVIKDGEFEEKYADLSWD